jgi:hypothetical protein
VFSVKHFFNLFDKQCRFTQVEYSLPGFAGLFRQPAIIKFLINYCRIHCRMVAGLLPDSLPDSKKFAGIFAGKVAGLFAGILPV